jgi:H+/Cl- antiporter ClcA
MPRLCHYRAGLPLPTAGALAGAQLQHGSELTVVDASAWNSGAHSRIEDLCDRRWRGPGWLRPAVGGLILGGLLLGLPQMYGVGYPVLGTAVSGGYVLGFLLLLLIGKIVATSLTIGIGGSGGVFAPSLFIGAMLGETVGLILHSAGLPVAAADGAITHWITHRDLLHAAAAAGR